MTVIVAIAVCGFFGAVSRHGLTLVLPNGGGSSFPWATLAINLSGSLLLGWLSGLALRKLVSPWWKEALGTGFLGAFTTFSAFNAQLWELWRHDAYAAAVLYAASSGIAGWLLASLGLKLGRGRER
ncbi:fluoride efflux transporter CrcB [Cohnella algarum]|uniref:fluoride efflux transporter CrcB n=1 Tax=Cohnella algarum TaxID=2044859 RepID=UPI00196871FF|nr:fluoride efflux transporter CrcB [Cohnella algarum]MBN2983440.1 fluoride efflux transporter CrcB [Cohnella algarum]